MPDQVIARPPNRRQRVAAVVPAPLRKAVRMAENYFNRQRSWSELLREFEPVDGGSRATLRKSRALAPFTALARLDSFQPPRLLGDVEVEVRGIGRFAIRAATDDVLHVLSAREPRVRQVVETQLPRGGTFVDAGANIGFYTVMAARRVGPAGQVVAFEMMPDTAAILRRHVALNRLGPVEVVERALSDRAGERISASVEPGKHGQASIVPAGSAAGRRIIEVETTTLDAALTAVERVDLLKIDLEGAEYLALCGGAAVLARTACIVFESNDEDRRIFDLLAAAGFTVERLDGCDFIARRPDTGSAT